MEAAGMPSMGPRPGIPGDLRAPKGSAAFAAAAAAAAATAAAILLASGSFSMDGLILLNGRLTVVLEPFLSISSEGLPKPGWIFDATFKKKEKQIVSELEDVENL